MATSIPPSDWPVFAFENRERTYNVDLLQDDYLRVLEYMRSSGKRAVPLWVFRSLCESYARLMETVSRGSNEEYFSAQDADMQARLDEEVGRIQENDFMTHGAMAIGEATEMVSRNPVQGHSYPDRANTHDNTNNEISKRQSTCMVDVYEVLMSNIEITSMDLSDRPAMLEMVQMLINSNKLAQPSSHGSDHILYIRWHKRRLDRSKASSVCIGFTGLELASNAVKKGLKWAGKSHSCTPIATGHKLKYCMKCLGYGHRPSRCPNRQRCSKCGSEHPKKICQSTYKECINCGGSSHKPGSTKCPRLMTAMMKAGCWPSRATVVNVSVPVGNVGTCELQGRPALQPQQFNLQQHPASPSTPTDTKGTEYLPDPSDSKKIIEHLDRLRALVIASRPTPSISEEPTRSKRKTQAPFDHVSEYSLRATPKRLKREEDIIKQEEQEDSLAQWERLYT